MSVFLKIIHTPTDNMRQGQSDTTVLKKIKIKWQRYTEKKIVLATEILSTNIFLIHLSIKY